ncbi:DUF3180 domain-containing protein [Sanguibacter antarcticus]|uniref:Uncharacterized protein DUF3180 n=1 Tax=Sanguibacter antarcticus TaxID=372484 RepID=A0A2A9EAL1_9MICO|nr:DUF3180 domain-containing protein [Sanguibacter antarcticus]PFG35250.1 uncharacterized protein DUF3180 [Sanguibacter antarcticus]
MIGRTRASTLALAGGGTLGAGWVLLMLLEDRGIFLSPVPWGVGPVLLVLGVVVFWTGWTVRAYQRGHRPALSALRAARTAALAKAAAVTGALLAGWYGAQGLLALGNGPFESQQSRALAAGIACVCALVLVVAGMIAERFCQLPPPSDEPRLEIGEDGAHD